MFSASNYVDKVDFAFFFITAISFALLILITILMIYFVFKYNRKKGVKPVNIHGNTTLEIVWTAIPVLLVIPMFYYGWVGFVEGNNPPKDAIPVKATAQMWKWTFEYPNGVKTDTMYVPQNRPVKVDLVSIDVNHAFFVPAFRIKRDVVPNRTNMVWFTSENTGSFDVACAEYCGLNHAYMYTKVVVLKESDYADWLKVQTDKMNAAAITQ